MSEGKDTDLTPPDWLAKEQLEQWEVIAQNKEEAEKMKRLVERPSEQDFLEVYNRVKPKPSPNEEVTEAQDEMQKIPTDGADEPNGGGEVTTEVKSDWSQEGADEPSDVATKGADDALEANLDKDTEMTSSSEEEEDDKSHDSDAIVTDLHGDEREFLHQSPKLSPEVQEVESTPPRGEPKKRRSGEAKVHTPPKSPKQGQEDGSSESESESEDDEEDRCSRRRKDKEVEVYKPKKQGEAAKPHQEGITALNSTRSRSKGKKSPKISKKEEKRRRKRSRERREDRSRERKAERSRERRKERSRERRERSRERREEQSRERREARSLERRRERSRERREAESRDRRRERSKETKGEPEKAVVHSHVSHQPALSGPAPRARNEAGRQHVGAEFDAKGAMGLVSVAFRPVIASLKEVLSRPELTKTFSAVAAQASAPRGPSTEGRERSRPDPVSLMPRMAPERIVTRNGRREWEGLLPMPPAPSGGEGVFAGTEAKISPNVWHIIMIKYLEREGIKGCYVEELLKAEWARRMKFFVPCWFASGLEDRRDVCRACGGPHLVPKCSLVAARSHLVRCDYCDEMGIRYEPHRTELCKELASLCFGCSRRGHGYHLKDCRQASEVVWNLHKDKGMFTRFPGCSFEMTATQVENQVKEVFGRYLDVYLNQRDSTDAFKFMYVRLGCRDGRPAPREARASLAGRGDVFQRLGDTVSDASSAGDQRRSDVGARSSDGSQNPSGEVPRPSERGSRESDRAAQVAFTTAFQRNPGLFTRKEPEGFVTMEGRDFERFMDVKARAEFHVLRDELKKESLHSASDPRLMRILEIMARAVVQDESQTLVSQKLARTDELIKRMETVESDVRSAGNGEFSKRLADLEAVQSNGALYKRVHELEAEVKRLGAKLEEYDVKTVSARAVVQDLRVIEEKLKVLEADDGELKEAVHGLKTSVQYLLEHDVFREADEKAANSERFGRDEVQMSSAAGLNYSDEGRGLGDVSMSSSFTVLDEGEADNDEYAAYCLSLRSKN